MIPIVAISNLVTAIVSAVITALIARSYQRSHNDALHKDFLLFFVFLTFYFGLLGSPSIFTPDTYKIGVILSMASLVLYFATAFFLAIPLAVMGYKQLSKIVRTAVIIFGLVVTMLDFYFLSPAVLVTAEKIFYFSPNRAPYIWFLIGSVPMASAMIASAFFIIFARRVNSKWLRLRSYLLGYGMLALILAAVLAYVVSPLVSSILPYNVVAGILALAGVILMGSGILMKPKTQAL